MLERVQVTTFLSSSIAHEARSLQLSHVGIHQLISCLSFLPPQQSRLKTRKKRANNVDISVQSPRFHKINLLCTKLWGFKKYGIHWHPISVISWYFLAETLGTSPACPLNLSKQSWNGSMSRQLCHAVSNLTDPYRSDPISNGPVSSHSTGNEDLVSFAWWGRNESIRTDCLIDPETCRNI